MPRKSELRFVDLQLSLADIRNLVLGLQKQEPDLQADTESLRALLQEAYKLSVRVKEALEGLHEG